MGIGSLAGENGLRSAASTVQPESPQSLAQLVNGMVQRVQHLAQQIRTPSGSATADGFGRPPRVDASTDSSQQLATSLSQLQTILKQISSLPQGTGAQGGTPQDFQGMAQQIIDTLRRQGVPTPKGPQAPSSGTGFPQDDIFQPSLAAQSPLQQARIRQLAMALGMDPNALRGALQSGATVQKLATQQGVSMKDLQQRLQTQLNAAYPGASGALRARIALRIIKGPKKAANGAGLSKNYPSYPARLAQQGTYSA